MAEERDQHLSEIVTEWTVVHQAHAAAGERAAAQRRLLERYGRAIHCYLLASLHDAHAAEDLAQEFALHLLRGRLGRADPQCGRFRDYVKGLLGHWIADHFNRRRERTCPVPLDRSVLEALTVEPEDADSRFRDAWRTELLSRTWDALAGVERQTGRPYYTVLRFRAEHPDLRSPQLAEQLAGPLGKPLTAAGVRQLLHRARERFTALLLEEVAQTLADPTLEQVAQELGELGLLAYCQPWLKQYRRSEVASPSPCPWHQGREGGPDPEARPPSGQALSGD